MTEINTTCPYCGGDSFYINTQKRVFYCHRASCHASGKLDRDPTYEPLTDPIESTDPSKADPPPHWTLSESAKEYLLGRGVSYYFLKTLPISSTEKGILFEFPNVREYWQERRWKPYSPPRWKCPTGTGQSGRTGVYYEVRSRFFDGSLVVTEGILDALRVGEYRSAVAVLGSVVHERQLELLLGKYKNLIYMPDGDVPKDKIAEEFMKFPMGSKLITLPPEHDPGSLPTEELRRLLLCS